MENSEERINTLKEVLEIIGKKQLAINEKILKDFRKRI